MTLSSLLSAAILSNRLISGFSVLAPAPGFTESEEVSRQLGCDVESASGLAATVSFLFAPVDPAQLAALADAGGDFAAIKVKGDVTYADVFANNVTFEDTAGTALPNLYPQPAKSVA